MSSINKAEPKESESQKTASIQLFCLKPTVLTHSIYCIGSMLSMFTGLLMQTKLDSEKILLFASNYGMLI